MSTSIKSDGTTIKSVHKALEVLEAFSEINDGFNLSCLSEKLNMNKSGLYRLLQVFKQRGYVEQNRKHGKYHLGMAAYMVGQNMVSNMKLLRTVRPVMERLVRETDETVYLTVRCDQDVLFFENIESMNPVNVMPLKGRRYLLSDCAAGKVQIAFGAAELESSDSRPDDGIKAVRQQGFATDADCLGVGVSSLSVPLLGTDKNAVGSLCFVGPRYRFTDAKLKDDLLGPLVNAGHAISAKLGYFGYHLD